MDAEYEISDLLAANGGDGTLGFVLQGINIHDLSGWSVSDAGDVNGDGFADLLIGATGAERSTIGLGGPADFGQAYVIFGTATNFGASLDLSTLDGTRGFVIEGIDTQDNAGYDVSAGGDINGDGFDDILIAGDGPTQPGTFFREMGYVIYGSATIGQNAAPVISALEPANAIYEERGLDIAISDLIEFSDADNNFIASVTIAITGNHDVANDSILATVVFPTGIAGSYNAATGIYTLQGPASPAAYQTAFRSLTYRNSFVTQADATRTLTITIDDGSTTTSVTRDIDMVIDNTINGTTAGDNISGGWGDDILSGLGGSDTLVGNAGDDILNGGDGNDALFAGGPATNDSTMGTDILNGDAGNDLLNGDQGIDTLNGGSGIDTLHGGDNDDFLNGGTEGDFLNGDAGNDILHGDEGNDTVNGGTGNDMVHGDDGDDILNGNDGDDSLFGGLDDDTLNGNDGDDNLFGGLGDDLLEGGDGADAFDGGDGIDTVTYASAVAGVTVDMGGAGSLGIAAGDSFTNVEILQGSNFTDTLTGDAGANIINGGTGDDTINGATGNDTLNGDAGDDSMNGQGGDDVLDGGAGNDIIFGGIGDDTLTGGTGNDRLVGNSGADLLNGGAGIDRLFGQGGNDIMNGEADNDVMYGLLGDDIMNGGAGLDRMTGNDGVDTMDGGAGNDFLDGGAGNDSIIGGDGTDRLVGGSGLDTIEGNAGNDRLFGGVGNDRLIGGTGNDRLSGGGQLDTFVFDYGIANAENDTILDFVKDVDTIEIWGGLAYGDLSITQSGSNVVIQYNAHQILVRNAVVADLDAAQFNFPPLAETPDENSSSSDTFVFNDKSVVSEDEITVNFDPDNLDIQSDLLAELHSAPFELRTTDIAGELLDTFELESMNFALNGWLHIA